MLVWTQTQLTTHAYKECTVIQPTWFFHRDVFDAVGGYEDEARRDLLACHQWCDAVQKMSLPSVVPFVL